MNNIDIYPENDYRDYLEHHGILGMKWGVRRSDTYPLKPSEHSASEKKAGWRKSLDGGSSNKIKLNRYDRAAKAAQKDADDLRKHGYVKEADAVQKVADKNRSKAEAKRASAAVKADAKQQKMDRRDIKKLMKDNSIDGEETRKVQEKLAKSIANSKEFKDYQKFHNDLVDQVEAIQRQNPRAKIVINKKVKEVNNKLAQDYYNKFIDVAEKASKKQATAILKDAGIKQTEENVKYAESILLNNLSKSRKKVSKLRTI